jgi:hypothetical protein
MSLGKNNTRRRTRARAHTDLRAIAKFTHRLEIVLEDVLSSKPYPFRHFRAAYASLCPGGGHWDTLLGAPPPVRESHMRARGLPR